ncbi:hypothetical protein SAMN05892883_2220 [Jatrophihabitans sp. GAS493]|uniref:antitoxin VbhA family protein n=1 Tax=Jatrophihabitans sp. GAS493 TaxID=1907575 RepID=UPI000BC071A2|nr:antitoxin VbhA family protein [Jatrophihabitans sp. GAS493]SOD72904.1 hypothetical protein SAMN05892883_2220 [Jatrophihabitans sp. GAS493]
MTVMSATTQPATESECVDIARAAGLTAEQAQAMRNVAASWAMENMAPTVEELRVGAELVAGRIDFAEARRQLGV